jgi:peroxiredoxin
MICIRQACSLNLLFAALAMLLFSPSLALAKNEFATNNNFTVRPAPFVAASFETLVDESQLCNPWGDRVSLEDLWTSDYLVILVMGTECPLARQYVVRFEKLSKAFENQSCDFILVDGNSQDSLQDLQRFVEGNQIDLPLLKDVNQQLIEVIHALKTPEAFILDRSGTVVYRGRVDDQYQPGIVRPQATRNDLEIALTQTLGGKEVEQRNTPTPGCFIGRRPTRNAESPTPLPANTPTFSDDIYPFLDRNCIDCHRAGNIGPMAFTDYDEVVGWSDTILEVVREGRMPPWHASNPAGTFKGEHHVSPEDVQQLEAWIHAGAPAGRLEELPQRPADDSPWGELGPPDEVVSLDAEPFELPTQGALEYCYFVVDPGWKEDRWIRHARFVPGNVAVVHHALAYARTADGLQFLGVYLPGYQPFIPEPSQAYHFPAGSKLIFQLHYVTTGRPEVDQSRCAIWFADESKVEEKLNTVLMIQDDFEIAPYSPNTTVNFSYDKFPEGSRLLSLYPHMHQRGKSMRAWVQAGSQREALSQTPPTLNVPMYDFNWQHNYIFERPIDLTPESTIYFEASFDNSASNPANPDPSATVFWGRQSWEEMAVLAAFIAVPREPRAKLDSVPIPKDNGEALTRARSLIKRFDQNGDQIIQLREVPDVFAQFGFPKFDINGDNRLSLDELIQQPRD